jgi:hypothetical protein
LGLRSGVKLDCRRCAEAGAQAPVAILKAYLARPRKRSPNERGCSASIAGAARLSARHVKAFEFCIGIKVPSGPDWLHEVKYDGYRLRVERDGDRVRLITRSGYNWSKRYPWIVERSPGSST